MFCGHEEASFVWSPNFRSCLESCWTASPTPPTGPPFPFLGTKDNEMQYAGCS